MVVLLLARNLVLLGSVLCTVAHGEFVVDVKETVDDKRVLCGCVTENWVFTWQEESGIVSSPYPQNSHHTGDAGLTVRSTWTPYHQQP